MSTAFRVENLGKKYIIKHQQQERYSTLRDTMANGVKAAGKKLISPFHRDHETVSHLTTEEFWALKNINFEIKQGDKVGIIGRNGAGKSTLLKILSRITEPTTGRISIKGRVSSLLEVGTGFHPELTGRENIFLNGAILGMHKQEIEKKFDEIVTFAEVEKFLDTPVKRYSSGMYVRLAFAVAAHMEPEILIVDEVLAVGDSQFQDKCMGKMSEIGSQGRTVILVSHNMPLIRSMSTKCMILDHGSLINSGGTDQIIEQYVKLSELSTSGTKDLHAVARTQGNQHAIIEGWIENWDKIISTNILMGAPARFCFRFKLKKPIINGGYGVKIETLYGQYMFALNNYMLNRNSFEKIEEGTAVFELPCVSLLPGTYTVSFYIVEDEKEWIDYINHALTLNVEADDVYGTGKMIGSPTGGVYIMGRVYIV